MANSTYRILVAPPPGGAVPVGAETQTASWTDGGTIDAVSPAQARERYYEQHSEGDMPMKITAVLDKNWHEDTLRRQTYSRIVGSSAQRKRRTRAPKPATAETVTG